MELHVDDVVRLKSTPKRIGVVVEVHANISCACAALVRVAAPELITRAAGTRRWTSPYRRAMRMLGGH